MSVESEAAKKRRMKQVMQLATAAHTLRILNQDGLADRVDRVADALHADRHYGKPVR